MTASSMMGLPPSVECLIKPVSGQARLTKNSLKAPLKISDGPRFHIDVQLKEIPISLSDEHYRLLVKLVSAFNLRARADKVKKWRPDVDSVFGNAKVWWRFALCATMDRIRVRNHRHSIQFATKRARQNVLYVQRYTEYLTEVRVKGEIFVVVVCLFVCCCCCLHLSSQ